MMACLRLDVAVGAVTKAEVIPLMRVAAVVLVLMLGLVALGLLLVPLVAAESLQALGGMQWWLLAVMVCGTLMQVGTYYGIRMGRFVTNGAFKVVQALIFVALALWTPVGLVVAYVLSLAVWGLAWPWGKLRESARGPWLAESVRIVRKHREYPLISFPASLLDTLSQALPLLIVMHYYGESVTGNYSQIQRLTVSPLALVSMSLGQVFFNRARALYEQEPARIRGLMVRVACGLAGVALMVALFLWLFGEGLLGWFLGDGWRTDTAFILLVTLPLLVRAVVSPLTSIFFVYADLKTPAIWQCVYFLTTLLLLGGAASQVTIETFLMVFCLNELGLYALYLWLCFRRARSSRGADKTSARELM